MVAGRATFLGIDLELLFELQAKVLCRFDAKLRIVGEVGFCVVAEIVNFFERAQMFFRCAVALKAPSHRVRFRLPDDLHLMNVAVAALAGNPAIHVRGVVEINVVW